MPNTDDNSISRRKLLSYLTTASIATTGLLASPAKVFAGNSDFEIPPQDKNSGTKVFNIRDFGAVGDGKTLDTLALQKAIDACTNDKGGIVLVPAGVFVIGTVQLKSNVTLHIAAMGVLLGTDDGKQYYADNTIPLTGDTTLDDGNVGLIYAVGAENFSIEGTGTIDGNGARFRSPAKGVPSPAGISDEQRPYHLLFYQCKNIAVNGIFLKDCAYHSLRVVQCEYARFEGLHIHSRVIHNNDGFHFISSRYVHVSKCDVQVEDDACALFGSCQFITVSDCSFSTRWSIFRFGGGIAENITVSDCIIYDTYGCPVKMLCGRGSRFENILFSNIIMKNVTGPISIGLTTGHDGTEALADVPGIVRNISFNNIRATVVKPVTPPYAEGNDFHPAEFFSCITLDAIDDVYLENISLSDVHVTFPGGGTAEQGALRDVPQVAGEYFEMGVPPSYALYARNVKGLTLQNVRFEKTTADARPAIIFDHVEDASVNGLSVQGEKTAESVVRFIDSKFILLNAVRSLTESSVFMQVEGAACNDISMYASDISKSIKPLKFSNGASNRSVKMNI
ncbi:MAG: glycosyl hydrolase family 28 protein [Bacteroidota bacterium]|nr:glycosyl hydrolase family 28 protein [Bacteroidota bacterium]